MIVRQAREKAGYTQKALADAIGVEYYTMISQIELGYISIPPALWVPLSDKLGLGPASFIITCLHEYQPELFSCLFGENASKSEVTSLITAYKKGELAEMLRLKEIEG